MLLHFVLDFDHGQIVRLLVALTFDTMGEKSMGKLHL